MGSDRFTGNSKPLKEQTMVLMLPNTRTQKKDRGEGELCVFLYSFLCFLKLYTVCIIVLETNTNHSNYRKFS